MKNKVPAMLKQMLAALSGMAKSKSLALRRKTDALRTRLIIFSLLHHDKKFFVSTLSHKLQNLLSQHHHHHNLDGDKPWEEFEDADVGGEQLNENAIVSYCDSEALVHEPMPVLTHCEPAKDEEKEEYDDDGGDDKKHPDLRHTLFDGIKDLSSGGSVIELVKHSKEDRGEEFVLENEIDRVADLFIRRFHRQMRLQKMESFKNYQEMLGRSV
ncbi:uncharacterized protein LOC115747472 [Rhodamnia argentea]|uniref:Uncharacterized protein LOC115747472 n=1 Tax=Rhodamnia argentea TaxID=178133 RepID=A0A8B8PXK6_9MYRT|nr:uncharacterized protein LOC115747472 [Rhodamnia argentea]